MTPRERVLAALHRRRCDQLPRFEIWMDGLLAELGFSDPVAAAVALGQDCAMLPSQMPVGGNAWKTGIDEWGRVWREGTYVAGAVDTFADLVRYSPSLCLAEQRFDPESCRLAREAAPDHCLIFGTHNGPFTAAYMAMGFERFFLRLMDDRDFVARLLDTRTDWCITVYRRAIELGAEAVVLGDDAASTSGPMVTPDLWRELVLPCHRRIVEALDVPIIWHSDGDIRRLLPMAVEAGFVGVHGLDPIAGLNLADVKRDFGSDLVLVGNVDVRVLCSADMAAVRDEVDRCLMDGGAGDGYMLATCNSIFEGMDAAAVREYFTYAGTRVANTRPAR